MDNNLLKQKLEEFALMMLDKYFEKPKDNQYWRQQLKITFETDFIIRFGNLYPYGGKRVRIEWDSNLIFNLTTYHLSKESEEGIKEAFNNFIEDLIKEKPKN
ncbi:hypothetical protein [Priestia megaterium]|uniref:hypothetical protein n=1 Tax=Priestia megaterium TaxID=1404 RepID=UPI001C22B984|nr:hypothetical protein [Priestia megaterium]MBU8852769.1 hypothetical protein [Bacillus sp. FJAT-26377]MCU7738884.1 hypothetical protein [Priestia megaterium]